MRSPSKSIMLWLDRMLAGSLWKQIKWIVVILFFLWLISYVSLCLSGTEWGEFCSDHNIKPWLLPLYLLIDTNALNNLYLTSPDLVEAGRKSLPGLMLAISSITYFLGLLIFNGIIISVFSNWIAQRKENYTHGLARYPVTGHYVIMGYDEMVPSVIASIFRSDHHAQIFVLSAMSSVIIRERIRKSVPKEYFDQIVINYGHRIARDYYPDIHLEKAKEVYVVGKRSLPNHDAVNVECVESICAYLRDLKEKQSCFHTIKRITCVFEDFDTYTSFRTTDIFSDITNELNIEFIPYNDYMSWARRVFVNQSYIGKVDQKEHAYPCLCRNGIGLQDEHYVHLVFVGFSNFAVTFANEAANLFHFPNYKNARTKITIIDRNADIEIPIFITRNHHFFEVQPYYYRDYTEKGEKKIQKIISRLKFEGKNSDFLDIDFEFIKGDAFTNEVQGLIEEWAKDEKQYLSIFLAMTNQRDNFALAMNMPDAVYNNEIPVFVRQDSSDNFITLLQQADTKAPRKGDPEYRKYENGELFTKEAHGRYNHIYPFGMNDTSFFADDVSFRRALLINYLYQKADWSTNTFQSQEILLATSKEAILKDAERMWKELSVAEKWSNFYFAYSIDYKIQSLRVMQESEQDNEEILEALSESEHNRWNVEKLLMGYRKPKASEDMYGKSEKIARKLKNNKNLFIHSQIRPYDDLSDDMKKVDKEFAAYIPWIVDMAKYTNNSNKYYDGKRL